jgi:hypothetical protein
VVLGIKTDERDFIFPKNSKPALGPNQPLVRLLPLAFSMGKKATVT